MIKIKLILFIFLLFHSFVNAQIIDNFDDGDITSNPVWSGDVANFKVDDDKSLRLNAPAAGESFIYLPSVLPDSFIFTIDVKMEFSPSASNFAKIFLMMDNADVTNVNGYQLTLGENGSADAIRFAKLINGFTTNLVSMKEGAMSTDPSQAKVRITFRPGGKILFEADYNRDGTYEDAVNFVDGSFVPSASKYFGIQCIYSATRVDKFVFDNLSIEKIQADTKAPSVQKIEVLNDKQIVVFFDEAVTPSSATNVSNYTIEAFGSPKSILAESSSKVILTFDKVFSSGKEYKLAIKNITDEVGNIMTTDTKTFTYIGGPVIGDIVISEILFDPYVNQQDFIEIYNPTDKIIELKGIKIKSFVNNQEKIFTSNYLLKAKSYLAITSDMASVQNTYSPIASAVIIENELPAFNNDFGNVAILLADNTVLDSFTYRDKFHLLINDTKSIEGISLEKISLSRFSNDRSNWHSAAKAVKYATPGYANSNLTDNIKPSVILLDVVSNQILRLTFDDVLTKASAENNKNYSVNQGYGNPFIASFSGLKTNVVDLEFLDPFTPDKSFELKIENIADKNNNTIGTVTIPFGFGSVPQPNDLVISEILFNPYTDAYDFVELYNTTDKNIELKDVVVFNSKNQQEKKIVASYIMPAKSYLAVTFDATPSQEIYKTPDTANFLQNALPAFNADMGNVSIKNAAGILLDSFDYNEDLHQLLFDKEDVKGVSLEKINLAPFNNNKSNWHSAAKGVNYATPGYRNSNNVIVTNTTDDFFVNKKTFSPNGDGNDDLLILGYNLDQPGFLANIEIYSSEGYKVKNLSKNELLGTSGFITWDGTNEDGNIERVGIYILKGSIFDTDGTVKYFKKECVLANFID